MDIEDPGAQARAPVTGTGSGTGIFKEAVHQAEESLLKVMEWTNALRLFVA
jgi:hypothetical protein